MQMRMRMQMQMDSSARRYFRGEQLGVGMPKLDRYPMVNLVCARAIENGQAFRPAEA